jgi:hypothetical protein
MIILIIKFYRISINTSDFAGGIGTSPFGDYAKTKTNLILKFEREANS